MATRKKLNKQQMIDKLESKLLDLQFEQFRLEDLEYMLKKTNDALTDIFEMLNEQTNDNKDMQRICKKQKTKLVKKTG